jgi:hypothetical protein
VCGLRDVDYRVACRNMANYDDSLRQRLAWEPEHHMRSYLDECDVNSR